MRILIAEDDRISRSFLQKFMQSYGEVDMAVDGMEAVDLYMDSIKHNNRYDLLCFHTSGGPFKDYYDDRLG